MDVRLLESSAGYFERQMFYLIQNLYAILWIDTFVGIAVTELFKYNKLSCFYIQHVRVCLEQFLIMFKTVPASVTTQKRKGKKKKHILKHIRVISLPPFHFQTANWPQTVYLYYRFFLPI